MTDPRQPGRECHCGAITVGMDVYIVKKEAQWTSEEMKGSVLRLLTNSSYHPRGIKVMLMPGEVGQVVKYGKLATAVDRISKEDDVPPPNIGV
eukprot:7366672-Ditylum_brightwellii.AAC.1